MFINCPHCRSLVATDPATDRPPPYCPICSAAIEDSAPPPLAAHDRVALHDDASRRLDAMLATLDDDARSAATAIDASARDAPGPRDGLDATAADATAAVDHGQGGNDRRADAAIDDRAGNGANTDAPSGVDTFGAVADGETADDPPENVTAAAARDDAAVLSPHLRERPAGEPPPIDVIRSPVEAIAAAGLSLPPATSMLEDGRKVGIAGFLQRLAGRRSASSGARGVPTSPADVTAAAAATAHAAMPADDRPAPTSTLSSDDARSAAQPHIDDAPARADMADGITASSPASARMGAAEERDRPKQISDDANGADHRADTVDDPAIDEDTPTDTETQRGSDSGSGIEPASNDAHDAPVRPAIVRPVDRPRVELPPSPLVASEASEPTTLAAPAALMSTLPLASTGTRVAPSFARPRRRTASGLGRITGAAIVVLGVALALQLLLADRAALAADARWRPAIAALCGALGCSLPPWREPSALALVDRDVRPHPTRPGVLRVTASFRNDARWPQPWPRLALTLSDVDGAPLATRDFSAREYLGAAPQQDALAPGQTASIAMDVVEPDTRSVAFDFELH